MDPNNTASSPDKGEGKEIIRDNDSQNRQRQMTVVDSACIGQASCASTSAPSKSTDPSSQRSQSIHPELANFSKDVRRTHRTWCPKYGRVPKCDICNARSPGTLYVCQAAGCQLHICEKCAREGKWQSDRLHFIDPDLLDWTPQKASRQKRFCEGNSGSRLSQRRKTSRNQSVAATEPSEDSESSEPAETKRYTRRQRPNITEPTGNDNWTQPQEHSALSRRAPEVPVYTIPGNFDDSTRQHQVAQCRGDNNVYRRSDNFEVNLSTRGMRTWARTDNFTEHENRMTTSANAGNNTYNQLYNFRVQMVEDLYQDMFGRRPDNAISYIGTRIPTHWDQPARSSITRDDYHQRSHETYNAGPTHQAFGHDQVS